MKCIAVKKCFAKDWCQADWSIVGSYCGITFFWRWGLLAQSSNLLVSKTIASRVWRWCKYRGKLGHNWLQHCSCDMINAWCFPWMQILDDSLHLVTGEWGRSVSVVNQQWVWRWFSSGSIENLFQMCYHGFSSGFRTLGCDKVTGACLAFRIRLMTSWFSFRCKNVEFQYVQFGICCCQKRETAMSITAFVVVRSRWWIINVITSYGKHWNGSIDDTLKRQLLQLVIPKPFSALQM